MLDDRSNPGERNRRRIDIAKDQDLRHWSRKLDVPADELVHAVAQVGDDPGRIEQHLRQRQAGAAQTRLEASAPRVGEV